MKILEKLKKFDTSQFLFFVSWAIFIYYDLLIKRTNVGVMLGLVTTFMDIKLTITLLLITKVVIVDKLSLETIAIYIGILTLHMLCKDINNYDIYFLGIFLLSSKNVNFNKN